MNNIRATFTIKDLENLSGIKAHTIRIWEKRYNLFSPERSEGNFRNYSQKDLQKMLNIAYLNTNNHKISKIASLSNEQIQIKVKEISAGNQNYNDELNQFKLSMMKFDKHLFDQVYLKLSTYKTFKEIFQEVFIPLLNEIGMLWTTNTITPANEHFISNLIIQKIQIQTEKIRYEQVQSTNDVVHILFLPMNEIHEIGLLYLNYLLSLNGQHTVFLGQSVPLQDLENIQNQFDKIMFVTCLTTEPKNDQISDYVAEILTMLEGTKNQCSIIGRKTGLIDKNSKQISLYKSMPEYIATL